jgi:hypothetical protein
MKLLNRDLELYRRTLIVQKLLAYSNTCQCQQHHFYVKSHRILTLTNRVAVATLNGFSVGLATSRGCPQGHTVATSMLLGGR